MSRAHLGRHLLTACVFITGTLAARAELRTLAPIVDVGVVDGGQKLKHSFLLSNVGTEIIEILDVQRGCGCLTPQLAKRTLRPGEQTMLALELRTLGQADGPHAWNLQVHYRDGQQMKTLPLVLRGTVRNEITVQPAILGMHVAKAVQQEITLTDRRESPLRVVAVDVRVPGVQVTKIDRAGKTTTITLSADASQLLPGRQEGTLTITTDDAKYDQLQVPFVVTKAVSGGVACAPEHVVLRPTDGVSAASAIVRLRSTNDQPVKIAKVEPSHPAVVCTWAPGPGNDATVRIQVKAGVTESFQTRVQVYLTAPMEEVLVIPAVIQAPAQREGT